MNQVFSKFHETEIIFLKSAKPIPVKELRECLSNLDFEEMDDFFFLDNKNKKSNWAAVSLITAYVFFDNKRLDLFEEEPWNTLKIDYLFASLPFDFINKFLDIIDKIAKELNLIVEHNGKPCTKNDLIMAFYEYREDVRQALGGEPGSKIVSINISMSYPRSMGATG